MNIKYRCTTNRKGNDSSFKKKFKTILCLKRNLKRIRKSANATNLPIRRLPALQNLGATKILFCYAFPIERFNEQSFPFRFYYRHFGNVYGSALRGGKRQCISKMHGLTRLRGGQCGGAGKEPGKRSREEVEIRDRWSLLSDAPVLYGKPSMSTPGPV